MSWLKRSAHSGTQAVWQLNRDVPVSFHAVPSCARRPVFVNNLKWQSFVMLSMSLGLLVMHVRWLPHNNEVVNKIRAASYALVFFCAMTFVLLAFKLGIKNPDDAQVSCALWDLERGPCAWGPFSVSASTAVRSINAHRACGPPLRRTCGTTGAPSRS